MTKDEVIAGIQACAKRLGKNPSKKDLMRWGIGPWHMRRHFGSIAKALEQAGMKPEGPGFAVSSGALLLDSAVRKLQRLPQSPTTGDWGSTAKHRSGDDGAHGSQYRTPSVCSRARPGWKRNGRTC